MQYDTVTTTLSLIAPTGKQRGRHSARSMVAAAPERRPRMAACRTKHPTIRPAWSSSLHTRRYSPLLDDDDDRAQQENEHHQTPGTHPQDQPHLLRALGHLQRTPVVLAGSWPSGRGEVEEGERGEGWRSVGGGCGGQGKVKVVVVVGEMRMWL